MARTLQRNIHVVNEKESKMKSLKKQERKKERKMKKVLAMMVVALMVTGVVIACGGMSPQPAPGDFDNNVPSLPSDDGSTTGIDTNTTTTNDTNVCPIHDYAKPCDVCASATDDNSNNSDLNDLSSDLPAANNNNTNDGQFVAIIL